MTKKKPKRMRPTKMWAAIYGDGELRIVLSDKVSADMWLGQYGTRVARVLVTEVARRKR